MNNYLPKLINIHEIIPRIDVEIDLETPDIDEIEYQMKKKLKNGRCVGTDGLVAEQIKYADSEKLPEYVHEIVRRIWENA